MEISRNLVNVALPRAEAGEKPSLVASLLDLSVRLRNVRADPFMDEATRKQQLKLLQDQTGLLRQQLEAQADQQIADQTEKAAGDSKEAADRAADEDAAAIGDANIVKAPDSTASASSTSAPSSTPSVNSSASVPATGGTERSTAAARADAGNPQDSRLGSLLDVRV